LDAIKILPSTQKDIFTLLAAVLHLGNVQFEEKHTSDNAQSVQCCVTAGKVRCETLGPHSVML